MPSVVIEFTSKERFPGGSSTKIVVLVAGSLTQLRLEPLGGCQLGKLPWNHTSHVLKSPYCIIFLLKELICGYVSWPNYLQRVYRLILQWLKSVSSIKTWSWGPSNEWVIMKFLLIALFIVYAVSLSIWQCHARTYLIFEAGQHQLV